MMRIIQEVDGEVVDAHDYCSDSCARSDPYYEGLVNDESCEYSDEHFAYCEGCGVLLNWITVSKDMLDYASETLQWSNWYGFAWGAQQRKDIKWDLDAFLHLDTIQVNIWDEPEKYGGTACAMWIGKYGTKKFIQDWVNCRNFGTPFSGELAVAAATLTEHAKDQGPIEPV